MRRRGSTLLVLLPLSLLLLGAAAAQARAQGLTLGFSADSALTSGNAAAQSIWIPRAAAEGAGIIRVNVIWSQVAPATRPAGFVASDPSSPGYNWTAVDAAVRTISSHGLRVLLNVWGAPTWAEGPGMPGSAGAGTWKPDPSQFGAFATALARRYDGHFPDPLAPGAFLPRVTDFQAWNEPNLDVYLTPQWTRAGAHYVPSSPVIYRGLLNAFYAAVKGVSSFNFVVAAGTAPYGDPPGGDRIPPVEFDRVLFCLAGNAKLTPLSCPDPPHLDAVSHHPYGIEGPLWHALNPDDAAVPDIDKIANVLHAAVRDHHVLPRGPKQIWVTEISWDSSPPDPQGVPIQQQARWLEQSFYVLWSQGVSTILWLQIVDSPPIPSYATTYQAGLYYLSGAAKPAAQSFRFPFVTKRVDSGHVYAWGRAPAIGWVSIEILRRGRWVVLHRQRVATNQLFWSALAVRGNAVFRAQLGSQTSLAWTQRR